MRRWPAFARKRRRRASRRGRAAKARRRGCPCATSARGAACIRSISTSHFSVGSSWRRWPRAGLGCTAAGALMFGLRRGRLPARRRSSAARRASRTLAQAIRLGHRVLPRGAQGRRHRRRAEGKCENIAAALQVWAPASRPLHPARAPARNWPGTTSDLRWASAPPDFEMPHRAAVGRHPAEGAARPVARHRACRADPR